MDLEELLKWFKNNYSEETELIRISKEEAKQVARFLNRFIKKIPPTPEEIQRAERVMAYLFLQKLIPHCDWEEGEEKIMVSSHEKLQTFL